MMISFLVLSGVLWTFFWQYDDYAARKEAEALAKEIADQIAMVGSMNPGYASNGLMRPVPLPQQVHGSPYILTVDGFRFQIRIEILGRPNKAEGVAFFPASVVYSDGEHILELEGFETTDSDNLVGRVSVKDGGELKIGWESSPSKALKIEAKGIGDGFPG